MKNKKDKIIFGVICLSILVLVFTGLILSGADINWYGLLIGMSFLIGVYIMSILAVKVGFPKDIAYDLLLILFPFALIGARLFFVIFSGSSWTFLQILQVWNGGLSIIGGIIGGVIGVTVYAIIKKKSFLEISDIIVPSLILGQAVGRWGNFANQEVFGNVVTNKAMQWFPFAVFIDSTNSWHYALFFYESCLNLLGFVLLLLLFKKFRNKGYVTGTYLFYYGIVRFTMEGFRYQEFILQTGSGLPISKIISLIFVICGAGIILYSYLHDKKRKKVITEQVIINDKNEMKSSAGKILKKENVVASKENIQKKKI